MSLNRENVMSKIIADLEMRSKKYKNGLTSSDILRSGLSAHIADGMQEVYNDIKQKGKNLAFSVFGVDNCGSWRFESNSALKAELITELKPDITELAKSIAADFRVKELHLAKTAQKGLLRELKNIYNHEVQEAVKNHLRHEIAEKAKKDVADMWNHLPIMLNNENTFNDVVAEHFSALLAADSEYDFELKQRAHARTRHHVEYGY